MNCMKKTYLGGSIAKSKRLMQLRKLAKLSRMDIAQLAGVSVSTYRGWEGARFGGIPIKRAVLLADALKTEGINVSSNWLMHGTEETPKKIIYYQATQLQKALTHSTKQQSPEATEQLYIKAELEFFCNNNNWKTISLIVPNDAMEPCFLEGDLVAGIQVPHKDFSKIIGLNCIIRTKNNKILLRQIQKSNIEEWVVLSCLNPNTKHQLIHREEEIIDIAPISWLRRKNLLSN